MATAVTFLLAVAIMLAESVLLEVFGVTQFSIQSGIIIAVYLGARRDFVSGGLLLAALLIPMEWLAAGLGGYYITRVVAAFFLSALASDSLQGVWGLAHVLLAVVATLLHLVVVSGVILLLEPQSSVLTAMWWTALGAVLGVGLASWPIGAILARVARALDPAAGDDRLEVSTG